MATQFDIFSYISEGFDALLMDYVMGTAQQVAATIAPVAWVMFGIYVVLWGFAMIRGLIDEPVTDALFRLLKIAIVLGFALNAALYGTHIVNFAMETPEALAQVIALDGSAQDDATIGTTADGLVQKAVDTAKGIWDQAGLINGNFGHYIVAIIVAACGLILAAVAFLTFLFAKFGLVFLLALGPLFILMVMFKTTASYFEGWVRQVVGFMLTMVFTLAAVSFVFNMVDRVADRAYQMMVGDQLIQGLTQLTAVILCGVVLLLNVKGMASSVAGGFSMAMGTALGKAHRGGNTVARVASSGASGALSKATGAVTMGASAAVAAARATGGMYRATNNTIANNTSNSIGPR